MTFCLRTLRSPAMRYLPGFQFGDGIKGSERSDAMRCRRTLSGHEKRMIPEIFSRVRFDECLEPLVSSLHHLKMDLNLGAVEFVTIRSM